MKGTDFDVVVVGYGPTGVTAANLLGAAGVRVAVVERDPEVFTRARAISTDEEVLRIWQRVGLADRLEADMLTGLPLEFVDAGGRPFITAELPLRGHGYPTQHFLYQPALEQVLRDGVTRYPTVTLLLGHECLGIDQDDSGVTVAVRDLADSHDRNLRASYVIAADGGSSKTRTALAIGYEGRTYSDRWVVIDTTMLRPWPGHDRLRFHCDASRPAVDCPTPLGHHRWEFPILPGEDEVELVTDAAIWRLLARYGIDDSNVEILRAVVYSHHVRTAERWRSGRVFLAGDAAHAMPPWIGQGMAAGVRDVANLSWKLGAVIRGELPDDVLDSYETERQPHLREITRRAVLVGRVITERRTWLTRMRNPVLRLLGLIGPVRDALNGSSWIPVARYKHGYLARTGSSSATGFQLPQPWVIDPAGERVRLDDALHALAGGAPGTRWIVVDTAATDRHAAWTDAGVTRVQLTAAGTAPRAGTVVDSDGSLTSWLTRHRAGAVALRPDGYVYTAAPAGRPLAPPPTGLRSKPTPGTAPTSATTQAPTTPTATRPVRTS